MTKFLIPILHYLIRLQKDSLERKCSEAANIFIKASLDLSRVAMDSFFQVQMPIVRAVNRYPMHLLTSRRLVSRYWFAS